MYCIDCGTQNLETTRYCSRCGSNLEVLRSALTQPLTQESTSLIGPRHVGAILAVTAIIGVVGFAAIFGAIIALSDILGPRIGGGIVPVILFAGGIGVFGLVMIIRMLLGLLNGAKGAASAHAAPARLAAPPQHAALPPPAFRQPVGSVVEHTTARLANYAPPPDERERER
ncbi:MAG: zinc ribbon domain-containing protein [Blastocatellia bacterium]|nr:zinc ribbon domain-containing protein [Blastocatellia bacterium]